jgi:hypothetical protein
MADHIDEYAAIGQAVTANQSEVAASIQRLRAQAYASGALRSNEQQKVEVQQVSNQPIYVIQPANPQVVFVPQYNPTVVYVAPTTSTVVTTSLITFGIGIGIGALVYSNQPWGWGGWGWGWGGRGIYYNHGPWGGGWVGGYRPPVIWYHPRPVYYPGHPGYGGNWHYHPPYYRAPYPTRPPVYHPPGYHPGSPGYHPPANGGRPVPKPYQTGTRPPQWKPAKYSACSAEQSKRSTEWFNATERESSCANSDSALDSAKPSSVTASPAEMRANQSYRDTEHGLEYNRDCRAINSDQHLCSISCSLP